MIFQAIKSAEEVDKDGLTSEQCEKYGIPFIAINTNSNQDTFIVCNIPIDMIQAYYLLDDNLMNLIIENEAKTVKCNTENIDILNYMISLKDAICLKRLEEEEGNVNTDD